MRVNTTPPGPSAAALVEHAGFVRALARTLLLGADEVDDVVQETWLAALRRPPKDARFLRPWMGVVGRRAGLKMLRSERRRLRRERQAARDEALGSTADAVARLETQRVLVEAVQSLAEPYRHTIVLRYFHGLTPTEIARTVDAPVRTVETRLRRALAMLRTRLDETRDGDRRGWQLALLPLAEGRSALAGSGLLAGGLLAVATSAKVWIAATIVLLVIGVGIGVSRGPAEPPPAEVASTETDEDPGPLLRPRAGVPAPRSEAPPSGRAGALPPPPADVPAAATAGVVFLSSPPVPGGTIAGHVSLSGSGILPREIRVELAGWLANEAGTVALGRARDTVAKEGADTQGDFVFSDLPLGIYTVIVSSDGFVPLPMETFWVKPEQGVRLAFTLSRGCEAAVCVVDARGKPVVGHAVRLASSQGRRRAVQPHDVVATNGDGEARWTTLEEGWYRAEPADGEAWTPRSIQVSSEIPECRVVLGAEVAGRVFVPSGVSLIGLRLDFVDSREEGRSRWATADVGQDGTYRMAGLATGTYRVVLAGPGFRSLTASVEVRAAQTIGHDIRVTAPRIHGRLTDETTGGALSKAAVQARRRGDPSTYASVRAGPDGTWSLHGMPPGTYHLAVRPWLSDLETVWRTVEWTGKGEVGVDVLIRPRAPGTLTLRLVGLEPTRRIALRRSTPDGTSWNTGGVWRGETVELTLDRGPHTLTVTEDGRPVGKVEFEMPPGGHVHRTFELEDVDR